MFRTGRKSDQPLPTMTELFQAYPNPFNSSTSIKIYLTKSQRTKLEIFDVRGGQVKILADRTLNIGEHSFMWNGRNSNGRKVSSGSYFYRLSAGEDVMIRRMILIK